jgi:hypothetical protein
MNHEDTKGTKKRGTEDWIFKTILTFLPSVVLGALGVFVVQIVFSFDLAGCSRPERFV